MSTRNSTDIRSRTAMVQKVIKHHFGSKAKSIKFNPAGHTNFVFNVLCNDGEFIVRIGSSHSKLNDYLKEQWAVEKAEKAGVPVSEILEVGSEIIPAPYMLQKKLRGTEASHHPLRHEILKETGKLARIIHSIPTSNFGETFNWSKNRLSKNKTWKEYLYGEWDLPKRISTLESTGFFTKARWKRLESAIRKMESWTFAPALNHGDIRLKNVIVDKKGTISGIIDWENCVSHIAPLWDLSIALHDLSIDNKNYFLQGYGIEPEAYSDFSSGIKLFNILNYSTYLDELKPTKHKLQFEVFKLRLNGSLDLFSL